MRQFNLTEQQEQTIRAALSLYADIEEENRENADMEGDVEGVEEANDALAAIEDAEKALGATFSR